MPVPHASDAPPQWGKPGENATDLMPLEGIICSGLVWDGTCQPTGQGGCVVTYSGSLLPYHDDTREGLLWSTQPCSVADLCMLTVGRERMEGEMDAYLPNTCLPDTCIPLSCHPKQ